MTVRNDSSTTPQQDPRAARSYDALIQAMLAVLRRGEDPAAVSITEIVKAAKVSRPTFYQHFADVPDLIRAATLHRLESIFARIAAAELGGTWEDFARAKLRILLGALQSDAETYLRVLRGPAAARVIRGVIDFLADQLLHHSPLGTAVTRKVSNEEAHARAEFLGAGATWRVVTWLESDFTGSNSLDEMVERLAANILLASGATSTESGAAAPRSGEGLP
ncbi:TetR/AcrR family transcriptional regulator [Gulosibacter molinativorax]|uniref:TetR/AcrR family transcriptional regulator n=1 Tax=Gulosibacter molinativorax TaxID=256821 RepID=A0ABT7C591_9MICO|nr:TetR/AcrR family transcriptional regulator [Gulosibacter molinativorax]MDJ1369972.1 TetR/AcrR family transcriptional regulator [Gulosibacter molinativorax]QUY63838.1 Hypotetical protein [Gulosibacter molinativorax]